MGLPCDRAASNDRNTIQRFVQDPQKPGIMYNHDNEYLHYQDDWYILDAVPDEYILVYYRGQNDAWVSQAGRPGEEEWWWW